MIQIKSKGDTPSSCLSLRARPHENLKTIVITGIPRGGTTFAASIVAGLGIPFKGGVEPNAVVGRRYSHSGINAAINNGNFEKIARLIDQQRDIWAVKHPRFFVEDRLRNTLRNPHYIIVLKEPLSVAMRARSVRDTTVDIGDSLGTILKTYMVGLNFVTESSVAPTLLISYDRAIRDTDEAVTAIGKFLGVAKINNARIASQVREDRNRYFDKSILDEFRKSPLWKRRLIGHIFSYLLR